MPERDAHPIMVSYIGDLPHNPPDDTLLVHRDLDYVRACRQLAEVLSSGNGLTIWVHSRTHFTWLRDFTEQIQCAARFEEKTPLSLLAEQWNVVLPEWLTDADAVACKLLDIQPESQATLAFDSRMLSHFLGPVFQRNALGVDDLPLVLKAVAGDDAKAVFKRYPFLHRCLEDKCQKWASRSNEEWVRDVCQRLPHDPVQVWRALSLWAGLNGYPGKLLEYVLVPEGVLFVRKVPPEAVENLPFEPTAREQALNQIELLFDEIQSQATSSDQFQKVVGWTSGRLFKEFALILNILKRKQFEPTEKDIEWVKAKFKGCPGVSERQLNSLRRIVKPKRPAAMVEGDASKWVQWAVDQYIPYRDWQVHNDHYDDEIERTVGRFSDWYVDAYASVHQDPDLSLTHCLGDIGAEAFNGAFTMILLVDCLPVAFMPVLDNAMRTAGFSRHSLSYRFAGLPTVTECNKFALLSGQWQNNAGNYEAVLKERSKSEWAGFDIAYLSTLKALSEMPAPREPMIAVLNLIDGDELLHSDAESKNTTHEDELHRLFLRMAEAVGRLSEEWGGPKDHFNIYVVTDHGACRVLDEEKQSYDSGVVKKLFPNEKHRFSAMTQDQVDAIPSNLWELGYRFKRPFVTENTVYFLPRGHNTVRQPGSRKGYMHGGVTPEEVIVPTALYKMVKTSWKKPAVRFLNIDPIKETGRAKFYIQRMITLKIEIQNPNATPMRIVRAGVLSPETDLKGCEPIEVPAGKTNTLELSCYFKKSATGEKNLEIELVYEIAGEEHILPVILESEFKSAMSSGFSLKDL